MDKYYEKIRVIVSARMPKGSLNEIIRRLKGQRITFAVSKNNQGNNNNGFQVWRQILPTDRGKRVHTRHEGHDADEVIETEEKILDSRNFVCIWDQGQCVTENENDFLRGG